MSLLSSFIRNQLLKAVEEEVEQHAPDIKERAIQEMQEFGQECIDWAKKKIEGEDNAAS